jgi:hypothetical protein
VVKNPRRLCGNQHEARVIHHYAYGDYQPHYARYVGEDSVNAMKPEAIVVYVSCEREESHPGKRHVNFNYGWWDDETDEGGEAMTDTRHAGA